MDDKARKRVSGNQANLKQPPGSVITCGFTSADRKLRIDSRFIQCDRSMLRAQFKQKKTLPIYILHPHILQTSVEIILTWDFCLI